MSHSAAMRALGIFPSAPIRCRQRPPVPMRPMLIVSLAPTTWAEAGSVRAEAAAVALRNERREAAGMGTPRLKGSEPQKKFHDDHNRLVLVNAKANGDRRLGADMIE